MNNSALLRIAYKAGVTRVSASVYDRVRAVGHKYLESVVNTAIIYCEHERKKIVSEDHALHAIEHVGFFKMYKIADAKNVKTCKVSNKKKLITKIKEYQKQSDCVTLTRAAVERHIKQIAIDNSTAVKWSKEALINIQYALEYAIYKLMFSALKITLHAKRVTMLDNDIDVTIDLIQDIKNLKI